MNNIHPDPAKIREIMDLIEKHLPDDATLNMMEGCVVRGPTCGTVSCFGGWIEYAIAAEKDEVAWLPTDTPWHDDDNEIAFLDDGVALSFQSGRFLFENHVGFGESQRSLPIWGQMNVGLWGNHRGQHMFISDDAYGKLHPTIHEVIDHWRGVADRIEAA